MRKGNVKRVEKGTNELRSTRLKTYLARIVCSKGKRAWRETSKKDQSTDNDRFQRIRKEKKEKIEREREGETK